MRKMKRFLSLLLCFVMAAAMLPTAVFAAESFTPQAGTNGIRLATTHTHVYRSNYVSNDTHHWQVCCMAACPDPEGSIKNYDTHDYADAQSTTCATCGYEKKFQLTVQDGEGSGSYTKGTVVDIEATVPDGYVFEQWTVVTEDAMVSFANDTSAVTSMTMPGYDVTIKPVFSQTTSVNTVTILAADTTVKKGSTLQLSASVSGTGDFDNAVSWSVSGGNATQISGNGLLKVGISEESETVIVTAKSVADRTKVGTLTVTIEDAVYVGGIILDHGEYLAVDASEPTTEKPADNYAYYDHGVLTLHNYTCDAPQYNEISYNSGIFSSGDLEIVLSGTNSLTCTGENGSPIAIWGKVTISEVETGGSILLVSGANASESLFAFRIAVESGTIEAKCYRESDDEFYYAIGYTSTFTVSTDLTITASVEPDGELGEYVAENHETYDHIKIEKLPTTAEFYICVTDGEYSLAGAKFKLENTVVNGTSYEAVSDAYGRAIFSDVQEGEYILSQVEAPSGYTASEFTLNFKVENGVAKYLDRGVYTNYYDTLTIVNDPKTEIEKINVAFSQIDMGNTLGMRFAFPAVEGIDFTGAYAEATMAGSTQTIPADKWTTASIGGAGHYVFGYSNIAAKQMADEITIVIYNADGEAISNEYVDSIQSYVMRNVDKKDAESKALMVDMLNYGAAAQTYYGYNAEDLANAQLSDAQKAYGTADLTKPEDIRVKGANYLGTRLELGSSIGMQMNFAGTTADMYAIVEFTNHGGTEISERVAPTEIGGLYLINITQIAVADGRIPVTVTVYNADGTVYGNATDSMASYIARMSNADALYECIMKFSDSAYDYLH